MKFIDINAKHEQESKTGGKKYVHIVEIISK